MKIKIVKFLPASSMSCRNFQKQSSYIATILLICEMSKRTAMGAGYVTLCEFKLQMCLLS